MSMNENITSICSSKSHFKFSFIYWIIEFDDTQSLLAGPSSIKFPEKIPGHYVKYLSSQGSKNLVKSP